MGEKALHSRVKLDARPLPLRAAAFQCDYQCDYDENQDILPSSLFFVERAHYNTSNVYAVLNKMLHNRK